MKKTLIFILILVLSISACSRATEDYGEVHVSAVPPDIKPAESDVPVIATPEIAEPDDYVEPYISFGGISWTNNMPVENTPVFIIIGVDASAHTIIAERGYFQKPVGVDLYDYSYQFQLLRLNRLDEFTLSENVVISLRDGIRVSDAGEIAAVLDEGYAAWEFEAADGEITALRSIPWRERIVYEALEPIAGEQLRVQSHREITYPQLEDNRRLETTGLMPETLNITEATEIFTDKFYLSTDDADYDAERSLSTLEELKAWYDGGGRYMIVEKNGPDIVSIYGIYTA